MCAIKAARVTEINVEIGNGTESVEWALIKLKGGKICVKTKKKTIGVNLMCEHTTSHLHQGTFCCCYCCCSSSTYVQPRIDLHA